MDVDDEAQAACLQDSHARLEAGDVTGSRALLQRYLEHPRPQHLHRALEIIITICIQLWEYKTALSYAERFVQLASLPESANLVSAYHLMAACLRHTGSPLEAISYCNRALVLGDSYGLQQAVVYGRVLFELGSAHKDIARKSAEADATLARHHFICALDTIVCARTHHHDGWMLSIMADCLLGLGKFPDALPILEQDIRAAKILASDGMMRNMLILATSYISFARGLFDIAQYAGAVRYARDCLAIRERWYAADHPLMEQTRSFLHDAEHRASSYIESQEQADREFRQCNMCRKISVGMRVCTGCLLAWYCDSDCKKRDLVLHSRDCRQCWSCGAIGAALKCSGCQIARYCSLQCALAFWPKHKADCPAGNKK